MIANPKETKEIRSATVRFAGDSGDGMQLAGMRFTDTSALVGNDIATLPDYPAEIRAPAGTVAGVSGFQINFAATDIHTPGDRVNALIAMNPAAFKANIDDVEVGGIVIVNESEFDKVNLRKAGYATDYSPIEDESYNQKYRIFKVPITRLTTETLADSGLGAKDVQRCKNMYALGLVFWLYDRPVDYTAKYLEDYFTKKKKLPEIADANIKALKAGYHFGETVEMFTVRYHVAKAPIAPGTYRRITGNEALAMGLVAAAKLSEKKLVYAGYPITPASDILHNLAAMKNYGVRTVQAEDEIAAICAAIGVSFAGELGVTGTSGPGIALKSEAMGLAVMTELPLIIVNVQRGGPSTGLPTKTEQSDLLQVMFGRNGDCPLAVVAPRSPGDCFETAMQAVKIAFESMVPVIILSDGYIANGAEPWRVPSVASLPEIKVKHPEPRTSEDAEPFMPYRRDANLARNWAKPGTEGLQHRLGGLEKADMTGSVCYVPSNHQNMTNIRQRKVDLIAERLGDMPLFGEPTGDLLVLGWGGTYGAITTATERLREQGHRVSQAHLRWLSPFPRNLKQVLGSFKHVLIPELNMGQLRMMIRARFLVDAKGLNKVEGQPFLIEEIIAASEMLLDGRWGDREFITALDIHQAAADAVKAG